jgi:uncharacterized integral membrane protein
MATDPTSPPEPGAAHAKRAGARRSRQENARLLAVAILAVLATLFAVLNLNQVKVHLLFGSPKLPLIVVIVVCLLLGTLFGTVLARHARGGRRD